jgi:hypothetical protein
MMIAKRPAATKARSGASKEDQELRDDADLPWRGVRRTPMLRLWRRGHGLLDDSDFYAPGQTCSVRILLIHCLLLLSLLAFEMFRWLSFW